MGTTHSSDSHAHQHQQHQHQHQHQHHRRRGSMADDFVSSVLRSRPQSHRTSLPPRQSESQVQAQAQAQQAQSQEGSSKPPPASQSFRRSLPTVHLEEDVSTLLLQTTRGAPYPVEKKESHCPGLPKTTTTTTTSSAIIITNVTRSDETSAGCLICFQSYQKGTTLVSLPYCGHTYHRDCLDPWFDRQCTCPYCRYEYPSTDDPGGVFEVGRQRRMKDREQASPNNSTTFTTTTTATTATTMLLLVDQLRQRQDELRIRHERRLVLKRLSFCIWPDSESNDEEKRKEEEENHYTSSTTTTTTTPPSPLLIAVR